MDPNNTQEIGFQKLLLNAHDTRFDLKKYNQKQIFFFIWQTTTSAQEVSNSHHSPKLSDILVEGIFTIPNELIGQ